MNPNENNVLQQIQHCCTALEDHKAVDLKVLYVGDISSVTDYYVLATGNSRPHLKALRRAVEDALREAGTRPLHSEGGSESGWHVVDAFDFVVHLFLPEERDFYRLETLWKDARSVPLQELAISA